MNSRPSRSAVLSWPTVLCLLYFHIQPFSSTAYHPFVFLFKSVFLTSLLLSLFFTFLVFPLSCFLVWSPLPYANKEKSIKKFFSSSSGKSTYSGGYVYHAWCQVDIRSLHPYQSCLKPLHQPHSRCGFHLLPAYRFNWESFLFILRMFTS